MKCKCDINQLYRGDGHDFYCPENPEQKWQDFTERWIQETNDPGEDSDAMSAMYHQMWDWTGLDIMFGRAKHGTRIATPEEKESCGLVGPSVTNRLPDK